MRRYELRFREERCTGCMRCRLACSELATGSFCPEQARIEIVRSDAAWSVRFAEACTSCGVCADSCFYEALEKVSVERGR